MTNPFNLQFVTIDSASTKDVDDAICVSSRPDGGYLLTVAITDPTRLVPIGSPEDQNARLLGATVYAAERALVKMLPGRISEHLGSLTEGADRRVFTFGIEVNADGEATSFSASRGRCNVAKRLAYEEIPTILGSADHPHKQMLQSAANLSRLLLAKRRGRGAMALYDLSRMIYMDEEGRLQQATRAAEMVGHIIVQETMILTNTMVARYLVENDIPALFRNHEARAAAPSGAELASTVQTWLESPQLDLARAEATFRALMGKAVYAATVKGHYGVAEACYTHITSPLRRYADLVNLRQLRAALKGEPLPYDQQQLLELGECLTTKAQDRKDERSDGFKAAVQRKAQAGIENGKLDHLAEHELSQAIKLAGAAGNLPEPLVDEVIARLASGAATDRVTDRLLTSIGPRVWPQRLRDAFVAWMSAAPSRAQNLVMHALQSGWLLRGDVRSVGEGTSFRATVDLESVHGGVALASTVGARKRDAEQAACVVAIGRLIGQEVEVSDRRVAVDRSPSALGVQGNPKGSLLELCSQRRWPSPEFKISSEGPSHAPVFACTVVLVAGGQRLECRTDAAGSKKEAEASACAAMLSVVNERMPAAAPKAAQPQTAAPNPVGLLQEAAQKNKWELPAYRFRQLQEVPPLFLASVEVEGPVRGVYEGQASSKQEAKTRAAAAALAAQRI